MAAKTQTTDISPIKFVGNTSRYAGADVIYWGDQNLLTFNTYKKQKNILGSNDKFLVVTPGTEYRPDLVSKAVYGNVNFWWRIMEANNIKDIFDFKAGTNLRIPMNLFR